MINTELATQAFNQTNDPEVRAKAKTNIKRKCSKL